MFRFGAYQLDGTQGLRRDGEELRVTPKSLALLQFFVERPGEILTKDQILLKVWKGVAVSDAALTSCVQELRHVLGDDAKNPKFLETVHRRGYRFKASVAAGRESTSEVPALKRDAEEDNIVGRVDELEAMFEAWSRTQLGKRQLLFISGEAGQGKTTLVATFAKKLEGSLMVGWGQCIQHFGSGEPFEPLLDAISRLCRQPNGSTWISALERYGPTWLAQLPGLLTRERYTELQRSVAGSTRERMFRQLTDVMEEATQQMPMLLCLDDLHWSDPSTLEWISAFAKRQERSRLMIIGTFRSSEIAEPKNLLSNLLYELKARKQCHHIHLIGLNEASISSYVRRKFKWAEGEQERTERLASLLHERTDGNPLFVINVLDDLADRKMLVEHPDGWKLRDKLTLSEVRIPDDIRQVIEKQIERLTSEQFTYLEIASVAGLGFSVALVASISGVSEVSIDDCLNTLSRQGRFLRKRPTSGLSRDTQFEFIHVLYRDVIYERIPATSLRELHSAIGEYIQQFQGENASSAAAELAMHFERGGDLQRALFYLEVAAENARHRSAFAEAAELFDRAVSMLHRTGLGTEEVEHEAVLLAGVGSSVMATEGWGAGRAEQAYSRAWALREKLGENPKLFPALWGLWLFYWGRGALTIAAEAANDLIVRSQRSGDSIQLLQAQHAAWATDFSRGDLRGAIRHADEGLSLYEGAAQSTNPFAFGNHDAGVCSRSFKARALALAGEIDTAIAASDEAILMGKRLGHPFSEALAQVFAASVHHVIRDAAATSVHATAAISIAQEHGFKLLFAWASAFQGWAEAETEFDPTLLLKISKNVRAARDLGSNQFQTHLLGLLAQTLVKNEQYDEASRILDEALHAAHDGELFYLAELRRLQGELLREQEIEEHNAEQCFRESYRIATEQQANLLALRAAISLAKLRGHNPRRGSAPEFVDEIKQRISGRLPQQDLQDIESI
jgi:predicted ATPase